MMTVGDLKHILEFQDENAEVRIAFQPSWPLEYSLDEAYIEKDGVLYLAASQQEGYLTEGVGDELGW